MLEDEGGLVFALLAEERKSGAMPAAVRRARIGEAAARERFPAAHWTR